MIKGADGRTVCLLTSSDDRQKANGTLILLAPALAQFALDQYALLGIAWNAEPKNTAIREAFVACGELVIALEPIVTSVSGLEDESESDDPVTA